MGHSYRDLIAWQKAKRLAIATYKATESFPRTEIYGLTSQLRRAAVSVVSNIAEGQGRLTPGEFQQFLGHARGSLLEYETQLEIAFELGFTGGSTHLELQQLATDVLALVTRLLESVRAQATAGQQS